MRTSTRSRARGWIVPALATLVLAAAGCGGDPSSTGQPAPGSPAVSSQSSSPDDSPASSPASSPGSSPGSTVLPTDPPGTGPPSAPTDVIEKSRVSGVLRRDDGCAELVGPGGRWTLLDLGGQWRSGQELTVTGLARPERSTDCEGIPFAVVDVRESGA